jgi:anti-anti-sigma regulatory factor
LEAPLIFLTVPKLIHEITTCLSVETCRAVIIDFSGVAYVDSTFIQAAIELLEHFNRPEAEGNNRTLLAFVSVNNTVTGKLIRTGVYSQMKLQLRGTSECEHLIFFSVAEAVSTISALQGDVDDTSYPDHDTSHAPLSKALVGQGDATELNEESGSNSSDPSKTTAPICIQVVSQSGIQIKLDPV